jgi:TolB-like protein/Flp pilus assembly protein TadD
MQAFLRELQRRNVLRAGLLYATSVWALAQGIAQLEPVVGAPDSTARWFLIAAVIGFPFWIAFAWFYEFTPDGIKRESAVDADKSILRATGRKLDVWIIGALSIAVVLLLTDIFVTHNNQSAIAPETAIADKSVAVLPLENESGDANALYFSDGLSEAFIDALSQFPGLKVIARASSFHFRNSTDPVSVIGAKLGVAHLLEGSVQRAGDAVRITAELINVKDGTALWSQHYDRPYKDLFKLQDDITNAVAAALKAKLMGSGTAPPSQSDRPPSGNLEAYNAYLEGQYFLHQLGQDNWRKAIGAYGRATALDPGYAAAWAGISIAWQDLTNFEGTIADTQKDCELARQAADKAIAAGPDLAISHNARGGIFENCSGDFARAEGEFRRAIALAPGGAGGWTNLASALSSQGRLREALAARLRAAAIEPLSAKALLGLATDYIALGQLDDAEKAAREVLRLEPSADNVWQTLSQIDVLRGNAQAAQADALRMAPGVWRDIDVMQALQIGKDTKAADDALAAFIAKYQKDGPYQIAQAYALRKDPGKMFEWLDRAVTAKDPGLPYLPSDVYFLPYRHDPRFVKLCAELKLPLPKD